MLAISDLCKTYPGGVRALDGVSLTVGVGLFGLLGPNGAGKSTLMRTIAALQRPDSGSITLDGTDVVAAPQAVRRVLGYLPQDFGVYPGVGARALLDHIAVLKGIGGRGERRAQVDAVLHLANLDAVADTPVSAFSGGMRQRFGIAQALLGRPRVIVVDEPTAGLDPEERNRFHNLLSEIGEDAIVLLSTHIVEDVSVLCPKMAVLASGRIILEGAPAQLLAALAGRLWRKAVPRTAVSHYRATVPVLSTHLFAGETRIHVVADSQPEPGFEPVSPGLEDVYFHALATAGGAMAGTAAC